mmetsp:Transcript_39595/g.74359  ORF Transcript_39595/g.74359 Transcript_39595/m.74359 type:complete len:250 (-) Transcript_39595:317-1066(-)
MLVRVALGVVRPDLQFLALLVVLDTARVPVALVIAKQEPQAGHDMENGEQENEQEDFGLLHVFVHAPYLNLFGSLPEHLNQSVCAEPEAHFRRQPKRPLQPVQGQRLDDVHLSPPVRQVQAADQLQIRDQHSMRVELRARALDEDAHEQHGVQEDLRCVVVPQQGGREERLVHLEGETHWEDDEVVKRAQRVETPEHRHHGGVGHEHPPRHLRACVQMDRFVSLGVLPLERRLHVQARDAPARAPLGGE